MLLHVVFEAFSCGPELGIFPWWCGEQETGQSCGRRAESVAAVDAAAADVWSWTEWTLLESSWETRLSRRELKAPLGSRMAWRGVVVTVWD